MTKKPASKPASPKGTRTPARRTTQWSRNGAQPNAIVERIIESARQVLLKVGHADLTTRRVAEAAGMTHGHLNYYFPSKRDLLRALIAHLLKSYAERFEAFLSDPNYPLGQDLDRLVRWLWTDAVSLETVRIFRELWALALHDPVIGRAIDDFYSDAMAGVASILQQARPRADAAAIAMLVQLFAMISEGGTILYGTRRERAVPHERILELVPLLVDAIAPELHQPADSAAEEVRAVSSRGRAR